MRGVASADLRGALRGAACSPLVRVAAVVEAVVAGAMGVAELGLTARLGEACCVGEPDLRGEGADAVGGGAVGGTEGVVTLGDTGGRVVAMVMVLIATRGDAGCGGGGLGVEGAKVVMGVEVSLDGGDLMLASGRGDRLAGLETF